MHCFEINLQPDCVLQIISLHPKTPVGPEVSDWCEIWTRKCRGSSISAGRFDRYDFQEQSGGAFCGAFYALRHCAFAKSLLCLSGSGEKLRGSLCSIRVFSWISVEEALGHIMSMAEITEGRLNLTAAQSRCHFNANCSDNCIPTRTPPSDVNACSSLQICKSGTIYRTKKLKKKRIKRMQHYVCTHRGGEKKNTSMKKQNKRDIPLWKWWIEPGVIMRLMLPDTSFEDCLHVLFSFLQKSVLLQRSHLSSLNTCAT